MTILEEDIADLETTNVEFEDRIDDLEEIISGVYSFICCIFTYFSFLFDSCPCFLPNGKRITIPCTVNYLILQLPIVIVCSSMGSVHKFPL